jgi:hypothetical protein
VFAQQGGYETGQTFVDGMNPALVIGGVVVLLGSLAAFLIPGRPKQAQPQPVELEPLAEAA